MSKRPSPYFRICLCYVSFDFTAKNPRLSHVLLPFFLLRKTTKLRCIHSSLGIFPRYHCVFPRLLPITKVTRKRAIRDCRPSLGLVLCRVLCVVRCLCSVFCVAFVYRCVNIWDIVRTPTVQLLAVMTWYENVPLWCNPILIGHLTLTHDVFLLIFNWIQNGIKINSIQIKWKTK